VAFNARRTSLEVDVQAALKVTEAVRYGAIPQGAVQTITPAGPTKWLHFEIHSGGLARLDASFWSEAGITLIQ
jgi:hypothetical protein